MKWLLLILMVAAAGAIFYFRDEIRNKFVDSTTTEPGKQDQAGSTGKGTGDKTDPDPKLRTDKEPDGGKTKPAVKPVNPPNPPAQELDEIAKRYPMPKFKSIEQAVGNWQAIPSTAFPRPITVNTTVKVVLAGGVGSSTWKPGPNYYALRADGPLLTVGRTKDAPVRGQVSIDQTNYKEVLTKEFDKWKMNQELIVEKKRTRYRKVMAEARNIAANPPSRNEAGLLEWEKELGKKPVQNPDGTVPIMLASLSRKDVNEITPGIIEGWGPVIREVVDGEAYWTATVDYKTVSMFGELNTEAQALMRNGKVMRWQYTGSGESVPQPKLAPLPESPPTERPAQAEIASEG